MKIPEGSKCEALFPCDGTTPLKRCNKPATEIGSDAGFKAYLCTECAEIIRKKREARKEENDVHV